MASELKPCPFCGGTDVNLHHSAKAFMSWISCKSCGLDAPSETGVTDEEAITYWNTRPAPAATDTGLVTFSVEMLRDYAFMKADPEGEYVTRSQAVELLAAKDREVEAAMVIYRAERKWRSELEAVNAAKDARIKELEADLKTFQDGTADLVNEKIDAEFKAVDLEAKLATAQKALEPFAKIPVSTVPEGRLGHVPDKHPYMVDLDGNVLFTASDIRKARAVLGGKPS